MASLTTQTTTYDAPAVTLADADAANDFPADNNGKLFVQNDDAGAITLTLVSEVASPAPGLDASNETIAIAAGARALLAAPQGGWNNFKNSSTSKVTVNVDTPANVKLAFVK